MVSKIEIDSETRCHDCDTNYLDNSALKVHLAIEHGQSLNVHEEEKPFRCEKCKTSYKLKGQLISKWPFDVLNFPKKQGKISALGTKKRWNQQNKGTFL